MLNFTDLVHKFPGVDAFDDRGTRWTFAQMAASLEGTGDCHSVDDDEIVELQTAFGTRLTVHELFDIAHDSDECCSAEVLCDNGKPVLLYKRIGDHSDYSDGLDVLDKPFARELLKTLLDIRTAARLQTFESETTVPTNPMVALWKGVQYLSPLAATVFTVDSPKWTCSFKHLFTKYDAYCVQPGGILVQLDKMLDWCNALPSYSSQAGATLARFQTMSSEILELDARTVLFSLVKDNPQALEAVVSNVTAPARWQVAPVRSPRTGRETFRLVTVWQHRTDAVREEPTVVCFRDDASAQIFVDAHRGWTSGDFLVDMDATMAKDPTVLQWETSRKTSACAE